ncbi:hypothetical protein FRACYDRAFT_243780 [Fragilariopsis cylindrus CCMP1102]|uniref:RING-type domain-containing protein n=1 Tax=Fragilariopsis cylindrus CCMP1102 TaxID=635003 RepID=A0A1E7F2V6_9STRA|nr:hypothetical protein FRACYDRAFT_243780 [Fragilariopsis cylindrus CCMP1102]|eukprot:OEU12528.1 hypothetical protein FRACYDRAFT_243780 [Fragilariopsis cylindrus CCMP1102]
MNEDEIKEAVSDNIRKRRILEPVVVERDTLQPTSKPQQLLTSTTAPAAAAINDSTISETPSASPSDVPRRQSPRPTETPSGSHFPSSAPSDDPSGRPSYVPSEDFERPSYVPSIRPSLRPSSSYNPSAIPSSRPSLRPSSSYNPSAIPSSKPSMRPSSSYNPSAIPSSKPSMRPSSSYNPSTSPSSAPSSDNTPSESGSPSPFASLSNTIEFLRTPSSDDTSSESESPSSPVASPPNTFISLDTSSYYDTPSESESPSPSPSSRYILNERGKRAKENIRNAIFGLFPNDNLPAPTTDDSREEVSPRDVVPTYPSPVHSNYNVRNNTLLVEYRQTLSLEDVRNKTLPLSLLLEDCIELYNKAFNSNGNQLILKNKHIVSKINANKSDIEVCLDIEDTIKDDSSNSKNFTKEESDTVEDSSETTTQMLTNGTCSICIDEFIENDEIVYSELCSHVYHKHCMVRYLATHAQREIHGSPTLDITDNPCPSCRQNYCQIREWVYWLPPVV